MPDAPQPDSPEGEFAAWLRAAGLREPDAVGEIAQAEAPRMLSERLQDPHRAVDRLNLLSGYCRTPFDIVE